VLRNHIQEKDLGDGFLVEPTVDNYSYRDIHPSGSSGYEVVINLTLVSRMNLKHIYSQSIYFIFAKDTGLEIVGYIEGSKRAMGILEWDQN
jgi:hypothetical protein